MPKAMCQVEACERPSRSRGWCEMHYTRWRVHGDPLTKVDRSRGGCSIQSCESSHYARGWCRDHWYRNRYYGDPLAEREVVNLGKTCTADGCTRPAKTRTYCTTHYARFLRTGTAEDGPQAGRSPQGAGPTHGKIGTYSQGCRCETCKEGARVWRRERYFRDWEANKAKQREEYARNRQARLDAVLKATYGITRDDYNRMIEEQGGGCGICGGLASRGGQRLNVDHCHATGVVRGILCAECNRGLGIFRDQPERLESAAAYLRRSGGN